MSRKPLCVGGLRASGKTTYLIQKLNEFAKKEKILLVCENPKQFSKEKDKECHFLTVTYKEYLEEDYSEYSVYIDELDSFVRYLTGNKIDGYTVFTNFECEEYSN